MYICMYAYSLLKNVAGYYYDSSYDYYTAIAYHVSSAVLASSASVCVCQ